MKNSINLFLLFLFVPVFSLTAQNAKELKASLQEGKAYYTPQLMGSNPASKSAAAKMFLQRIDKKPSVNPGIRSSKKSSSSMTWPQLKSYIDANQEQLNDVTVNSGILDQRAPQIVSDGTEMFIAFESYDTQSGFYPYGTIEIYHSINDGSSWSFFTSMDHPSYHLYSPQITIVGNYIVVTCQYAGLLYTARWNRSDLTFYPVNVPSPAVSAAEYIIGHKMTTDFQEYFGAPYIYMASIFKQADGKNRILFSISMDTAYTWEPYESLGLSQSELNAASVGLDFSSSGLYLAYIGTDTSAGSILMRKSTDFGSTWTPEIKLPMFFNGGLNKKVGPMISAIGSRVAVIYQYDYFGDATDWKTGSDFDIYAVVSANGGGSWEERMVNSTYSSEILPGITTDYDENFYVSYIRDGRVRVSMAGQEYAFGAADSSLIANASLDDFTSIFGSPIPSNNTAYTTWTEISNSNGLDILGAETTLKIPPASPTNLISTVVSNTEIKLTWTDNSSVESGFAIYYRQAGTADIFEKKGTVGTNITTFTVTGLTPSMGYEFYVRAFNTNGYSLRTNIETAIPSGGTANPPTAPRNLTAVPGNGRATLTWNRNLESDFLKYRIYYGTTISSSVTLKDSTSGGALDTTKTIAGLTNGTAYSFRITSVNNAGIESGFSNSADVTPIAPADNTPPAITLNAPTGTPVIVNVNGQVGAAPQVSATAADGESGVYQMQVAYRNTSEQTWSYSARVNASTINYGIPTTAFVLNNKPVGVNYRVGAWDNAGNVAWSPYASIDVKLAPQAADQPSFTMPAASSLDNKTTAYRIISVPYNLTNKQPANLLTGFGSHSENSVSYVRWRFQRYVGTQYQDYDQFSTENAITPGAAFFFIVRDQGSQITVQGENIVRSDIMYNDGIAMQNGWNIVGNPFTIPYPIDSLEFYNASSVRAPIRQHAYYSGTGPVSGWDTASASVQHIKPWSGVALFVNSTGTLKFPSTGQSNGLPKTSIPQMEKVNAVVWTLAVNAYRTDINMRCEGSSLGMAQGAYEGDDPYDSYLPPIIGDKNVALYFKNADGAMMRDIRPMNGEGSVWEMRVVTGDANARVKLQWSEKLNLPNSMFEAYLIDTDLKTAHNLKETQSLEVNSGNGVRSFRVVIGKKSYVEENNAGVALTPSSMKLYANYPNPFNPETVIRYNIPGASASYMVKLKIFNVLGQEVATLVNEQKLSGYYEVKFNGINQSSGVYFYQISITDGSKTFQEIKKMVLMK